MRALCEEDLLMLKRMFMMLVCVSLLMAVAAIGFAPAITTAEAQRDKIINAPTAIQLQTVVSGLTFPVFVTHARDGTNRLFIIEQAGVIRVAQPGASSATVFLDITNRVLYNGEQG